MMTRISFVNLALHTDRPRKNCPSLFNAGRALIRRANSRDDVMLILGLGTAADKALTKRRSDVAFSWT